MAKRRKKRTKGKAGPPARRIPVEEKRKAFAVAFTDPGRETFCNGTQSAIAAGYSKRSAHVTASRLLRDAKVLERIRGRLQRAAEEAEFSAGEFIRRSLQQADAWLDEEGRRVMQPVKELEDGTLVITQVRPNETNRRALEMAGIAAGHYQRPGDRTGATIAGAAAGAMAVANIYIGAELPPTRRPARLEEIE